MSKSYIVNGASKLEGELSASGSKNATLPILAASILSGKTTTLYNVPKIEDTRITLEILREMGCKIKEKNEKVIIDSNNIKTTTIPHELMKKLRSSVIIVGALISRFKSATFTYPGGCDIGVRPINLHLSAFEKMGIKIDSESSDIKCSTDKILGTEILLDFPSVGATENIMMAAVLAEGDTIIRNAAMEPEIVDLQRFLNRMGAKIQGAGTNLIKIEGVKVLKNVSYNIMPDRIEAGTLMCAVAATGGDLVLNNIVLDNITPAIVKLEEMGCKIEQGKNSLVLNAPKRLKAVEIKTMPYPGFPTDMQSIFASTLTLAKGTSIIVENIFESRFKYISELNKMGAKISTEGKMAVIKGVKRLHSATVLATDLRGGAGLVIAGLATKGVTVVENADYILRGYEKLEDKLNSLGANIQFNNMNVL